MMKKLSGAAAVLAALMMLVVAGCEQSSGGGDGGATSKNRVNVTWTFQDFMWRNVSYPPDRLSRESVRRITAEPTGS